jgi:Flp pilus assembly protein TadD
VVHYRRAVELDPGHRGAHFNLGYTLRRLGRSAEAERSHRRAVALEPGSGAGRYLHALTLIELGRWREARGSLEEAHRLLPGDRYLANLLARVLAATSNPPSPPTSRSIAGASRRAHREPTPPRRRPT